MSVHSHFMALPVTIGGVTQPARYWCAKAGLTRKQAQDRVGLGWPLAKAVTLPLGRAGILRIPREARDVGWVEKKEHSAEMDKRLRPEDFVPCERCSLRGHVAGDPVRCRQRPSLRLGGWQMETGGDAE